MGVVVRLVTDDELSRRSALRLGAGGLAAATAGGLAGCSSIPFLGGGGGGGSSTVQKWAYAPGEIADQESYVPQYRSFSAIRAAAEELPDNFVTATESRVETRFEDLLDVDAEDVEWEVDLSAFAVASVNHTVADAVEHLEDELDFDEDDEVNGYTTVVGPDGVRGYALDGSTVIVGAVESDVAGALEDVIGTQRGDVDMYVDEDEDFADAVTNVDGDTVRASVGGFQDNVVATGTAATFEGEETTAAGAQVFDDRDDVDRERFREFANEEDDLSVSFSGRVVTFERTLDTDEYTG